MKRCQRYPTAVPRIIPALLLIASPGFSGSFAAAPAPALTVNARIEHGIALLSKAEDEQAAAELERAAADERASRVERAKAHLYLGVVYYNLFKGRQATKHFRHALSLAPTLHLPETVSPKIRKWFAKLRREQTDRDAIEQNTDARSTPDVLQRRTSAGGAHDSPVVSDGGRHGGREKAPAAERNANGIVDPATETRLNWPAMAVAGGGLLAFGTGLALGAVAAERAHGANDLTRPTADAQSQHDSASGMAVAANVMFGVAAASALVAGILFYAHGWSAPAKHPTRTSVAAWGPGVIVRTELW